MNTTQVAEMVERSSGGVVKAERAATGETFKVLGLTSLAFLRLIDTLENDYGYFIDLEDKTVTLRSVPEIVAFLETQASFQE